MLRLLKILLIIMIILNLGCVADSTTGSTAGNSTTAGQVNRLIGATSTATSFASYKSSTLTLTYTDADNNLATSCGITSAPSSTVMTACSCDSAGVCTVGMRSHLGFTGATYLNFYVMAGGKRSTTGTVNFTIDPSTPNAVPVTSNFAAANFNEDTATTLTLPYTDSDSDLATGCTLSNLSHVTVTQACACTDLGVCTVSVQGASNYNGAASFDYTVTTNYQESNSSTASLTIDPVNDKPTISSIASQSINESATPPTLAFTISDVDSTITCASVTASSSNTTLMPVANIVIAGTAPNCTVKATPATAQYGIVAITLTLTDAGTPLPAQTASTTFAMTVVGYNDPPTISTISNMAISMSFASGNISFTIGDTDSTVNCSNVTATSTDISLIPVSGIAIGGTAPNCTVNITPTVGLTGISTLTLTLTDNGSPLPAKTASTTFNATVTSGANTPPSVSFIGNAITNEDVPVAVDFIIGDNDSIPQMACDTNLAVFSSSNGLLVPGIKGSDVVFSGTYPSCRATFTPGINQSGSANIVIRVTDNGSPMPVKSIDSNIFTINVNAVNDPPSISTIPDQNISKNGSMSAAAFTVSDVDSAVSCADVIATSSDQAMVLDSSIIISGGSQNCTVTLTPVSNATGSAIITLTVTDHGLPLPALSTLSSFNLNIGTFNLPPTISAISNQSTLEGVNINTLNFTIADSDSVVNCSDVTGTSNNTALILDSNITIGGTAPNCTVSLVLEQYINGTANITLTLTDQGTPLPAKTATTSFSVVVQPFNDPPIIGTVADQNVDEDTTLTGVTVNITDYDSVLTCASLTAVSSNTTLVPNANIVISGTVPNCNLAITPAANKNGAAMITLTLKDNGTPLPAKSVNTSFTLNVNAVPDLSGTLAMKGVASSTTSNTYSRSMVFSGLTVDEAVSAVDVCLSRDANGNGVLDVSELCNVQNWMDITSIISAANTASGTSWASYKIKDGANGAIFTSGESPLRNSCSVTNRYFLSVKVFNAGNKDSNVISSAGWTFWEPTCLGANLSQWLDATDLASMTITATKVSLWKDKSTYARDVSQVTGTAQPIYSATAMGTSLPGITFNGANSLIRTSAFAYAQATGASYMAVIKGTQPSATKYLFSEGKTTSASNYYSPLVSTTANMLTGKIVNDAGTTVLAGGATTAVMFDTTAALHFIMATDSTTNFLTYSNGLVQTGTGTTTTRGVNTIDYYCLGAQWRTAKINSGFVGSLGEFIITNGVLSTTDRQKLEGYINHKWESSLSAVTPAHPYLSAPP